LRNAGGGEITVGQDDFIAVPHLHKNEHKFRGYYIRNILKHLSLPFKKSFPPPSFGISKVVELSLFVKLNPGGKNLLDAGSKRPYCVMVFIALNRRNAQIK
jgi:hypothetical protein